MPVVRVVAAVRRFVPVLLVAVLATCGDDGQGPPPIAQLALQPVLSIEPSQFGLVINNVRIRIVRPPDEVVIDTTVAFDINQTEIQISLEVPLKAETETFSAQIDLQDGTTVLFSGTQSVTLREGANTPPEIPLTYQGPGGNVTAIFISPRDTSVTQGDQVQFDVAAEDASGQPVTQFFVVWRTSDANVATINAGGQLTAPNIRDQVLVEAETPNGVLDETTVFFVPAVGTIALLSPANPTALVGSELPFDVQVLGTDDLPLEGVDVQFAAPAGASVLDPVVTTDASGNAGTTITLATTSGTQTFTASVAGGPTLNYPVTATPDVPAAYAVQSGNNQTGTVNQALPAPIAVLVTDQFNNPVPGIDVDWAVTSGGGSVSPVLSQSNAAGVASTQWTLGPTEGTQTAQASIVAVNQAPVAFTATANLGGNPVISWTSAVSGNWSDPANWDLDRVPAAGDDVFIDVDGTYTVTVDVDGSMANLFVGPATGVVDLIVGDPDPGVAIGRALTVTSTLTIAPNATVQVWDGGILGQPDIAVPNGGSLLLTRSDTDGFVFNDGALVAEGAVDIASLANSNTGDLLVQADPQGPTAFVTITDAFTNAGVVSVFGGILELAGVQSAKVNSGVISANAVGNSLGTVVVRNAPLDHQAGANSRLIGSNGVIDVSASGLTLGGNVNPGNPSTSPGELTFIGDYPPAATAALNIDIAGLTAGTQHDVLDVSGPATFGGALNLIFADGFTPSVGDRFTIMFYTSQTGQFGSVTTSNLGAGLDVTLDVQPTELFVEITPAGVSSVTANSATSQTGTVGQPVAEPPSVFVADGGGAGVPGVSVLFTVTGGGTVNGAATANLTTDANGFATLTDWTLGTVAGGNSVSAEVSGFSPVVFTATAQPDVPVTVAVQSGNNQTGDASTTLPAQLVARVEDQFGNGISGQTITFTPSDGSVNPTSAITNPSGAAATTWTLGVSQQNPTVTATSGQLTPAVFTATVLFPNPTILLSLPSSRIAVGGSATLDVTLSDPAPAGGLVVTVASDNTNILDVQAPPETTILEGETAGQVVLNGINGGVTTVRANAAGFVEGTLSVTVSTQVLGMPTTLNVPFGGTASLPVQISVPAPVGGVDVTLVSTDPSLISVETPVVSIPEGLQTTNATVRGVFPGTATVTGTTANFGSAQTVVTATAGLTFSPTSARFSAGFSQTITVGLSSGGSPIPAPAPGIQVTLTPTDPTCLAATSPVTIPTGLVNATTTLTYGGSAILLCQTQLTATAPDITDVTMNVTVDPNPGIFVSTPSFGIGQGLQQNGSASLGFAQHGGTTVTITSSDPSLLLVSLSNTSVGVASVDVPLSNGSSFVSFWLQALEGQTGTVDVTVSAPGFTTTTNTVSIVQPALDVIFLNTTQTTFQPDDPFQVRLGVPNGQQTFMQEEQQVRFGGTPAVATVVSSDAAVAELVTTAVTGGTVDVTTGPAASRSPGSVSQGGVALRPVSGGTTNVSATIPGFLALPTATIGVTVSTPATNFSAPGPVGAGLQQSAFGSLGASQHGGVTVTLTSDNPAAVLLAPDQNTPGAASIDISILNGSTGFSYWVQGVSGQEGQTATITSTTPGFTDGSYTIDVVQPALDVIFLNTNTTSLSPSDPFQVRLGIPNGQLTFMQEEQGLAAGTQPVTATVAISDLAVAQLVTTPVTGDTVTVDVTPVAARSPSNVTIGGVEFDPLGAGSATVSATIPGFAVLPTASVTVNVTAPNVNISNPGDVGAGLQQGAFASLGASEHGGVDVTLTSDNPAAIVLSPNATTAGTASLTVSLANGQTSISYYVQGVEGQGGQSATITVSAPGFNDGTYTINAVDPALDVIFLNTSTTSLTVDDPFQIRLGIPNAQQTFMQEEQAIRAGGNLVTATVTNSNGAVGQLATTALTGQSVTTDIAVQSARSPGNVASGGVAFDPLGAGTTTVSATIPGFVALPTASVTVTVTSPAINMSAPGNVGSGLQQSGFGSLGAPVPAGETRTVTVTSSNPSVLLVSPNVSTAGTASIDILLTQNQSSFSYYIQGVEGLSGQTVSITATADGYTDGSTSVGVVQPAIDIIFLNANTTSLNPDDPFQVRTGIPNANQTFMQEEQTIRAGSPLAPYTVNVTNSDAAVAQLVSGDPPAGSQSADLSLAAQSARTPSSVAAGGVAFEPLTAGTTTVSATLTGFIALPTASVAVNVTTPTINPGNPSNVGDLLQRQVNGSLGASDHGGVTVRITSTDPSRVLVAPNNSTPGAAFIDVPVNQGSTGFTYWVQGVEGQLGSVTISVTAPGFTDASATATAVETAIDIIFLGTNKTVASADDPFQVRLGVANANQTGMQTELGLRAGGAPLVITIDNSNATAAQLVTTATTGQSVTVTIAALAARSPGTVASGGVAFDVLAAGTTVVSASNAALLVIPTSAVTVNISP